MLLQSHRGVIEVFPAVPEAWRDVDFTTLRARGGFLVSARRKAGKVTHLQITSESGGACHLRSPLEGRIIELNLKPGETWSLAW